MAQTMVQPTASQMASAASHLERRSEWRYYRVDGVRYVALQSGNSGKTYSVRADAAGCSCVFYERTGRTCSHCYALELAALEDDLFDGFVDAALGPPAAKATYDRLFPGCRDCGDLVDGYHDNRCRRCGEDAEWQARRDSQQRAVAAGEVTS